MGILLRIFFYTINLLLNQVCLGPYTYWEDIGLWSLVHRPRCAQLVKEPASRLNYILSYGPQLECLETCMYIVNGMSGIHKAGESAVAKAVKLAAC